jgi:hypothetical protein
VGALDWAGDQEGTMTADALASTWANRELPILTAALRRLDAGETFPNLEDIRAELDLDATQMRLGTDALESAGYLTTQRALAGPDRVGGFVTAVGERARRELGTWPSSAGVLDALVAALDRAADSEVEPTRKSHLKAAAQTLAGMARDVAVGVIAAKLGGL